MRPYQSLTPPCKRPTHTTNHRSIRARKKRINTPAAKSRRDRQRKREPQAAIAVLCALYCLFVYSSTARPKREKKFHPRRIFIHVDLHLLHAFSLSAYVLTNAPKRFSGRQVRCEPPPLSRNGKSQRKKKNDDVLTGTQMQKNLVTVDTARSLFFSLPFSVAA